MTQPMKTLDIDWADLELAFRDATDSQSYLDTVTGEVMTLMPGFDDEADIKDKLKRFPNRFVRVEPVDKEFTKSVIKRFINGLTKGSAKKKLEELTDGPGGITRAMTLIKGDKPLFVRFARFEQSELVVVIEGFLKQHNIRAASEPPAPDLFEGQN